ncbi:hypothetical protein ScPMuIL_005000 [Solemya velum]
MESIFIPHLCQLKEELHIIDNFNRWVGDLCEGLSRSARKAATVRILRALGRSPVGGCAGLNDLRELLVKAVFAVVAEQDEHDATSAATRISNRVDHNLSEIHKETKELKMVIKKHIAITQKLQKIPKFKWYSFLGSENEIKKELSQLSINLNKKIMSILQTETEGILLKLKTIASSLKNQPNPLVQIIERTDTEALTNELMKSLTTEYWYADVKQFTSKSEPSLPKCIIRLPSASTYGGPHSKMGVSLIADQSKGEPEEPPSTGYYRAVRSPRNVTGSFLKLKTGCAGLNDLRELLVKAVFAVVVEQDEHDATSAATRISNRVDHNISEIHKETKELKMVIKKHIAITQKLQKISKLSINLNKKIMAILQTEREGILLKLKTIASSLKNQPNPLVQTIERTDTEAITNELMKSLTTEYWYADVKQFTSKSEPSLPKCIIRLPSASTHGGPHSKMDVSLIADQSKGEPEEPPSTGYYRAVRSPRNVTGSFLKLKTGKTVKQKFVDRDTKIGFGWQRRFAGGPKSYGFFYTDNMKLAV